MIHTHPTRLNQDGANHRKLLMCAQTWTFAPGVFAESDPPGVGDAGAALTPDTHEGWFFTGTTLVFDLVVNLGATRQVDYGAIGGFSARSFNGEADQTVSISVQTSPDSGGSWENLSNGFFPVTGRIPAVIALGTVRPANMVRLRVSTPSAGARIRVPVFYTGRSTRSERPIYGGHSPMLLNRTTRLTNNVSGTGQFLGQRIRRQGLQGSLSVNNLTAEWVREFLDPVLEHIRALPFFIAWRPSEFPNEVQYVWSDGQEQVSNIGTRDLMQFSVPLRGFDDRSPD